MIVTDKMVILNNPKTGSSFVRECVKSIHSKRKQSINHYVRKLFGKDESLLELILPNIKVPNLHADQHGTYRQIPEAYRKHRVMSVVRNPYSKFLSAYEFKHWARFPALDIEIIRKSLPNFPDLNMDEFVIYNNLTSKIRHNKRADLGIQTLQFVQMFCSSNPEDVLDRLDDAYINSGDFEKDFGEVTFLRQEFLNSDLAECLSSMGYSKKEVEFVSSHQRVNVTNSKSSDTTFTEIAYDYVTQKEKYLLALLKQLGFSYSYP